jgi:hypothetical protein
MRRRRRASPADEHDVEQQRLQDHRSERARLGGRDRHARDKPVFLALLAQPGDDQVAPAPVVLRPAPARSLLQPLQHEGVCLERPAGDDQVADGYALLDENLAQLGFAPRVALLARLERRGRALLQHHAPPAPAALARIGFVARAIVDPGFGHELEGKAVDRPELTAGFLCAVEQHRRNRLGHQQRRAHRQQHLPEQAPGDEPPHQSRSAGRRRTSAASR